MKTVALCGVLGTLAFVITGYTQGLFDEPRPAVAPREETAPTAPTARFPEDLVRAVRRHPVPQAAAYNPDARTHRMVIFKASGALHSWQDNLADEWQAETVEQTSLVVVIVPKGKKMVSRHTYPNGEPPIERFQWELLAYVVEAKTGELLGSRHFINVPRTIREEEAWELTALGQPVSFHTVFNWVASMARSGFPRETASTPLITVVD